jgi:LPS export ABC transporter protein LptC
VRLIKPATTDKPMTTMQTEALTVFPEEDIAQGKSRVTITQGKSVVSGDSIHYNGRTNIAVLGGRVKGTFYRAGKS